MIITLYNISKRNNSTKRPSDEGVEINVKLKEVTSVYNPTFLLTGSSDITRYNYLKWDNRFYYINDINYMTAVNIIEIICNIDVLATYKEDILNTSAFIRYSAENYDNTIIDRRLSTELHPTIKSTSVELFSANNNYFVSYIGSTGITYVMVTQSGFEGLSRKLADPSLIKAFMDDPSDYLSKSINSVTECITSAHMLPFDLPLVNPHMIILGANYDTGIPGFPVSHNNQVTRTLIIPYDYTDFRRHNEFLSMYLYLPGYGVAQLNADDFSNVSSITITINYDPFDGGITYRIGDMYKFNCNVAVPVQIGSIGGNRLGLVGGIANAIGGLVTGNLGDFASGLYNATMSNVMHEVGSVGGNGGASSYLSQTNIVLTLVYHDTTISPNDLKDIKGRPTNKVLNIGTLHGYVESVDACVVGNAPQVLKDEINGMLNGGIYIE